MKVPIINRSNHPLPAYATEGSSGMDLRAFINSPVTLAPLQRLLINTGVAIALPIGYEAQVRPRSGLALKHGITVLNSPGTIDADYRGEIKILLVNLSEVSFIVQDGDRIAQLIIAKYEQIVWEVVSVLNETARGVGGHGSTGKA